MYCLMDIPHQKEQIVDMRYQIPQIRREVTSAANTDHIVSQIGRKVPQKGRRPRSNSASLVLLLNYITLDPKGMVNNVQLFGKTFGNFSCDVWS